MPSPRLAPATAALLVLLPTAGCLRQDSAWSPPAADIYAARYIGAVMRSANGGNNWVPLGSDPRPLAAYVKTLEMDDSGTLYVGTTGGGLFALPQNDAPYHECGLDLRSGNVRDLYFSSSNGILWVGTACSGVFASWDDGQTWVPKNEGLPTYRVNCLAGSSSVVYCGTEAGLFRWTTGGPWTAVEDLRGLDVQAILVRPRTGELVAGIGWAGSGTNLYIGAGDGTNWRSADEGLPRSTVFCLASDESSGRLYAGTAEGAFQTTGDGARWRSCGGTIRGVRVFSIAAADGYCYAATAEGLFGSAQDSDRWNYLRLGPGTSAVTDVIVRRSTPRPASES